MVTWMLSWQTPGMIWTLSKLDESMTMLHPDAYAWWVVKKIRVVLLLPFFAHQQLYLYIFHQNYIGPPYFYHLRNVYSILKKLEQLREVKLKHRLLIALLCWVRCVWTLESFGWFMIKATTTGSFKSCNSILWAWLKHLKLIKCLSILQLVKAEDNSVDAFSKTHNASNMSTLNYFSPNSKEQPDANTWPLIGRLVGCHWATWLNHSHRECYSFDTSNSVGLVPGVGRPSPSFVQPHGRRRRSSSRTSSASSSPLTTNIYEAGISESQWK